MSRLDVILCPGCAAEYARGEVAAMLTERMSHGGRRGSFWCGQCGWEWDPWAKADVFVGYRPPTVWELTVGRVPQCRAEMNDASVEYLMAIVGVVRECETEIADREALRRSRQIERFIRARAQ